MLVNNFLFVLGLSVAIEVLVAFLLGFRQGRILGVIVFANFITNPLLNLILYCFPFLQTASLSVILEILVIIIEWRLLLFAVPEKKLKILRLSFIMNFVSFLASFLL